jgi:hypothetical protein
VSLNGQINLTLQLGYDPADGVDPFPVLDNDGSDAIGGTGLARFAIAGRALEEGATFFAGGQGFRISYLGGTGNDVVLQAVPEPGVAALLLAGACVFARRPAGGRRR